MKQSKKKQFNEKMGIREPKYLRLKNGGVVRSKYAGGGPIEGVAQIGGAENNYTPTAIQSGTNQQQLSTAYQGAQGAIGQQQGLANTFVPQAGQAVAQQNQLAGAYTNMMNGQGPNPAVAQLNQATGQNVTNQAALMAGQRGAGANVGLMAREQAQQGAATQQASVGQAATLQAQQSIAAQQNLAALSAQQAGQATGSTTALNQAQQNEQNILQGANTAYNNATVSQQSIQAQIAQANAQMNANIGGALFGAPSSVLAAFGASGGKVEELPKQMLAVGGQIQANPLTAVIQQPQPMQNVSSGYAQVAPIGPAPTVGNISPQSSVANPFSQTVQNIGQNIKKFRNKQADRAEDQAEKDIDEAEATPDREADGGEIDGGYNQVSDSSSSSPDIENINQKKAAQGGGGALKAVASMLNSGGNIHPAHDPMYFHKYFSGGATEGRDVPALVSPKEVYLSPEKVHKVVHEGADPMKIGYQFPGEDKVKGKNSKKNDFIKTTLKEGGIIVPISVTQHKRAPEKSREFVLKHMRKPGSR